MSLQSLRQNFSRSVSIGQALYFTVCPVVFQKHQPDSVRVCPSCLWSSLSSADSQDLVCSSLDPAHSGQTGPGIWGCKEEWEVFQGGLGFQYKEKERRTAVRVYREREEGRRLLTHLESLSIPPSSMQGSAPRPQPPFSFIPTTQMFSLLCQLFQTCFPDYASCLLTHFPLLSSLPPPCTIKTPFS